MFYEKKENIDKYIKLAQGYDGRALVEILRQFLPEASSVLELGMGPGKDLLILNEFFDCVGSDRFPYFLEIFKDKHPNFKMEVIDALEMNTTFVVDAIFSNKVMHHFSKEELKTSLSNQAQHLTKNGIVAHSFWKGDKNEVIEKTFFQYYLEEELVEIFSHAFEPQVHALYSEMDRDDSIFIIARKKN